MDKDNCLVQIEGEDGNVFNMLILKEFDYKDKRYAILTEIDKCHCDDEHDCDCDDSCDCGCQDGSECKCDHECHCGCEEDVLGILEITKDENGNEIFKSIDDEKLFDEVVEEADKILFED